MRKWLPPVFCLAALATSAAPAEACDEPVYQRALAAWHAGLFEGFLFHRGPLDDQTRAAMEWLNSAAGGADAEGAAPANLVVREIDLDAETPAPIAEIWDRQKSPPLPYLVLMPPLSPGTIDDRNVFAGPLDMAAAKALLDSPVRQALARRLRSGEAIVWVLLTGDDAAENAAARDAIRRGSDLSLRDYVPPDAGPFSSGTIRPVRYGIVELSRDDPAEGFLRALLLRSEPDLAAKAGADKKPVALPIFGQGRSLTGLTFEQIVEDNVREVCDFLLGPCSCMVSEMAPGVDLLIRTDWSTPAEPIAAGEPPSAAASIDGDPAGGGRWLRNALMAVGLIAVGALAGALIVRRRPVRS